MRSVREGTKDMLAFAAASRQAEAASKWMNDPRRAVGGFTPSGVAAASHVVPRPSGGGFGGPDTILKESNRLLSRIASAIDRLVTGIDRERARQKSGGGGGSGLDLSAGGGGGGAGGWRQGYNSIASQR